MELKEIADGLAARFGLGELAVEDGEAALEIDGMPILLSEGKGAAIVVTVLSINLLGDGLRDAMDPKLRR